MAQHIAFHLAGSAVAIPRRRVPSTELDALVGRAAGWVEDHFDIATRFWADADETSSALGAEAARNAIADAGWNASDLDVIVGACGVMEQPIPGTAVLIQRRLGLGDSGIASFDVNATCLSFLLALDVVLTGFAAGKWRRALIVGADIASAALDFSDPEACAIFGDGAVAMALEADGAHRLLGLRLATYGEGADHCRLEAGGTRLRPHEDLAGFLARSKFRMDGVGVFKATARRFPGFMAGLLAAADKKEADLDTIIPHQASATALEHLKRSIAGAHGKTVDIFSRYGNQIAVSLPHALHTARTAGLLAPGSTSLLIGSSAGISLGGAVVRW
jgi:3-oxoacyl-[acyl-carrier-protein] synthase III